LAKIYRVTQIHVGLRKCSYDHELTSAEHLSNTAITNIFQRSTYNMHNGENQLA